MEARILRVCCAALAMLSLGASYRTPNFIVDAPTVELAHEIGQHAERFRKDLALEWLGRELPPWRHPCPIRAQVNAALGAGGATSFIFRGRGPSGWRMTIQGSRQRVLDSVLPHEITHTIFATHFGQPLPRWADEGACTTVEHVSEKQKQEHLLTEFLTTGRGIAFNRMFAMTEYPADIMPLYSQGYALAQFLIAQGGKRRFVAFVGEGLKTDNWPAATHHHYDFQSLSELQVTWLEWVRQGRPTNQQAIASIRGRNTRTTPVQLASARRDHSSSSTSREDDSAPGKVMAPIASAAKSTSKGWYASRKSGGHDTASSTAAPAAEPNETAAPTDTVATTYTPGSTAAVAPLSVTLTRPQPPGHPRQTVLQWEHTTPGGRTTEISQLQSRRPSRTRLAPATRY